MWLMIALPKNSWTYFKFVLFWVSWDPSWWYSQFNSPPALCCVYITLWVGGYISRLLYFFPLLLVLEPCLVWCVWQSEKTCLLTNRQTLTDHPKSYIFCHHWTSDNLRHVAKQPLLQVWVSQAVDGYIYILMFFLPLVASLVCFLCSQLFFERCV